jgi:hypothetical protein
LGSGSFGLCFFESWGFRRSDVGGGGVGDEVENVVKIVVCCFSFDGIGGLGEGLGGLADCSAFSRVAKVVIEVFVLFERI